MSLVCRHTLYIPLLGLYLNREKDMRYNIQRYKEREKCQSGGSGFFRVMWENAYTNNNGPASVYGIYVWWGPLHPCPTVMPLLSTLPDLSHSNDVGSYKLCNVV